ncbi:MAG: hypothetical protein EPN97_01350 [Alphaproteobacteria bacterium]|nr:MAG: hypothetical protein EPN97_01350 [Alphaproteobacteria bacterium]
MGKVVYLLIGPTGAGKTYIGGVIEQRLGIPYLNAEPIFLSHAKTATTTGYERQKEGFAVVESALDELMQQRGEASYDTTAAAEYFPTLLKNLRSKYDVKLIRVLAKPDTCLQRVKTRDLSRHIPVTDEHVMEVNDIAMKIDLPWDLVIHNDPPLATDKIVMLFKGLIPLQ